MIKICDMDGGNVQAAITNAAIATDGQGFQYTDVTQFLADLDDVFYFMSLTGDARRAILGDEDPGFGELFALAEEHDAGHSQRVVLIMET